MTFEEFQATRTRIDDVREAGRYAADDSTDVDAGWEYATGLFITEVGERWPARCRAECACHLIVGNMEWIGSLEDLERRLYDCFSGELAAEPTTAS